MFTDKTDGVAFNYPNTWVVKPQRTNAFRVKVGEIGELAFCTLGTTVVPKLKGVSAEEMVRSTSKQDLINGAKQKGTDLTILDFQATKVGNRHALYTESESIYQSLDNIIPVRSLNVTTKVDDRVYILSCFSSPADLPKHRSMFRSILSSLTIRF